MVSGRRNARSKPSAQRKTSIRPVSKRRSEIDVPDLYSELAALLEQVRSGRVTTYGWLAEALGAVPAARWVAAWLLNPAGPAELPRHRVVLRDGKLGKFHTGNPLDQAAALEAEGVVVKKGEVDLDAYGFREFESSRPLERLQGIQRDLLDRLVLKAPRSVPELVAGVDVSYAAACAGGPATGTAAYAVVEVSSGRLAWSTTLRAPVTFPYIPGYLSFRELPILLRLLEKVRDEGRLVDVIVVDGNGTLHHRHAGIATHLGIAANVATIGIGKSLLCGNFDAKGMRAGDVRPVTHDGEVVAQGMMTSPAGRPIFVSPGHRVDLPFAVDLARRLVRDRRVPEPIYYAHSISRAASQST